MVSVIFHPHGQRRFLSLSLTIPTAKLEWLKHNGTYRHDDQLKHDQM